MIVNYKITGNGIKTVKVGIVERTIPQYRCQTCSGKGIGHTKTNAYGIGKIDLRDRSSVGCPNGINKNLIQYIMGKNLAPD